MKQGQKLAKAQRISNLEAQPERSGHPEKADTVLTAEESRDSYRASLAEEAQVLFASRKAAVQAKSTTPEASVKVISYMGSAGDNVGNDGDFYLDELTNILYGPKTDGVWPEEGVEVAGPIVCKRTFLQLKTARLIRRPAPLSSSNSLSGFLKGIYAFIRFRVLIRSRDVVSLRMDRA